MASINKVILIGNLGKDPETRYSASGDAITNVSIATTDKRTNKDTGQKVEETEWHRVTFFGKLAEIAGQYLKKGLTVYVEGKIKTRKWKDKDGNDKYSTDIIADQMQILTKFEGYETGGSSKPKQAKRQDFDEDQIPF